MSASLCPPSAKLADWSARLDLLVDLVRCRPFEWGAWDCGHFAADAIYVMTGQPFQAYPRRTPLQTQRALRQARLALSQCYTELPGAYAQRGDVVLVQAAARPAGLPRPVLAVCLGGHCAAPGSAGLVAAPLTSATVAWRL